MPKGPDEADQTTVERMWLYLQLRNESVAVESLLEMVCLPLEPADKVSISVPDDSGHDPLPGCVNIQ
jgi:hypothetical protein